MVTHPVTAILDTVLSTPGMEEAVKMTMKISRKNLLLLSKVIERGLSSKQGEESATPLLEALTKETKNELAALNAELLEKAGLTAVHEKLKTLYANNA